MTAWTLPALMFLAVPLLPVLLALLVHHSRAARALAPWIPATGLLLLPLTGRSAEYSWMLIGVRVGLDETFAPLLLLATVAWTLAGCHARRSIARADQGRFWFFWLATWCGNLCVLITRDAASFYAAYTTLTLAAWGLVVHEGRPADYRAGRVYIVMALLGEAMIISALLLLGGYAGNVPLAAAPATIAGIEAGQWVAALFAGGFAVKMGLAGLHMWLPLAHPQAPVPASAVLSGVILKAGLAGWLAFLPLGSNGFGGLGAVLLAAGVLTAFYGVAVGLCQTRPKTVLAYSSLSQMGLVTVPVGLALIYGEHAAVLVTVAVLFAVHHGLAKTALFLGIDIIKTKPRLARALLWLPAASLCGLPLTSGAVAKVTLKGALPAGPAAWLEPILALSSIATTLLLIRFLRLALPAKGRIGRADAVVVPWLGVTGAGLILPWLLFGLAEPYWLSRPFAPAYLLSTAWPVALGVLLGLIYIRQARHLPEPVLPEGDIIALFRRPSLPGWPTARPYHPGISRAMAVLRWSETRLGTPTMALTLWFALLALIFLL